MRSAQREIAPESIHPDTPMTPEYRKLLLRCIANHARGELQASNMYASWIRRAPGPAETMYVAEIAKEETEHWYGSVQLMVELGVDAGDVARHQSGQLFYHLANLAIPRIRWLDMLMAAFLIDRAAYFIIEEFAESSYAPWAKLAKEILHEEEGHAEFGVQFLRDEIKKQGPAAVQRALHKWWRLTLYAFGPPYAERTDAYIRLGLKTRHNEERRLAFRRDIEPRIRQLDLEVPKLLRETYPYI
jgi:1,2-phenylacetyl-CoA epoxidase catalytic subunit